MKTDAWLLSAAVFLSAISPVSADEHLFGYTRTSETLPKGHFDLYQFTTFRTGKPIGTYRAWDFDTELEYGFTDRFQMGVAVTQHYFHIRNNDELENTSNYQYGGLEVNGKYNILSPFKDPIGLALRVEGGWLKHDDVGGLNEDETYVAGEVIFQKNFLDDTLIVGLNLGVEMAWGKKPAEEYDYEIAFEGAFGVAYRFAPNWYFGVDSRVRSEYPEADLGFHEHTAVFVGPALHYGAKRWWATLSWGYQVWGYGIDEEFRQNTFLEEPLHEVRLKVGLNF